MGGESTTVKGRRCSVEKSEFEFLELLDNQDEFIRVPAETVLFREGEKGDRMFVILEGEVRLSINDQDLGTEVDGGIVGEMALIDEALRSATATTVTDCVLAPLDLEAFMAMVRKKPAFAVHVMQVLSQRLRLANEILTLY
jgi:CRP-like cAMP-binding protein